jgi:hypothetical protein
MFVHQKVSGNRSYQAAGVAIPPALRLLEH